MYEGSMSMVVPLVFCCRYQNRACPTSTVHAELLLFPVVSGLRVWDRMCFPFLRVTVLLLLCKWMLFQDQEWNLGFPPLRWLLFVKDEHLKGSLCLRLLHISTVFTILFIYLFCNGRPESGSHLIHSEGYAQDQLWKELIRHHQKKKQQDLAVLLSLSNLTLFCLLRSCSVLYLLQFLNQKIIWGLACKLQNKPGSDWGAHKQYCVGILAELLWLFIMPEEICLFISSRRFCLDQFLLLFFDWKSCSHFLALVAHS